MVVAFLLIGIFAPVFAPPVDPDDPYDMPRDVYRAEPQKPTWLADDEENLSQGDEG